MAERRAQQGAAGWWPEHRAVAAMAETYLRELHEVLKSGRYRPQPVRRVEIPKPAGAPVRSDTHGEGRIVQQR